MEIGGESPCEWALSRLRRHAMSSFYGTIAPCQLVSIGVGTRFTASALYRFLHGDAYLDRRGGDKARTP